MGMTAGFNAPEDVLCICCSSILSLVQFLFSFVLYSLSYLHKKEQREIKIEPRIKLNSNIYNDGTQHITS